MITTKSRGGLHVIMLTLLWSLSGICMKTALLSLTPITIVTLCLGIAAISLRSYCYYKKINLPHNNKDVLKFIIMGAFGNWIPLILTCYSLQHATTITIGIILATIPICTALLAHLFLDEKLKINKIIGMILGFAGILILLEPTNSSSSNYIGIMLAIMSAISCSSALVYTKKYAPKLSNTANATLQVSYCLIILIPLMLFVDGLPDFINVTVESWAAIIVFAILGTATAFVLYFKLLQKNSTVFLASINYLLPIFKTVIGVVFLNEIITSNIVISSILVLLAMTCIYHRSSRHKSI